MMLGARMFSYCLLLILCRRRFRQGREKSCLFFAGSNISSNIQHPSIHLSKDSIESIPLVQYPD
jgi:hypothetical protein